MDVGKSVGRVDRLAGTLYNAFASYMYAVCIICNVAASKCLAGEVRKEYIVKMASSGFLMFVILQGPKGKNAS